MLRSLINVGVGKKQDPDFDKYIIQTNINGIIYSCLDLTLACVFLYTHTPYIALILCISASSFLFGSLGLNRLGFTTLSRISTVSIGSVLVMACSFYLGKSYLAHASLLLGAIFPFVYFRIKELPQIIACLTVPVICYLVLIFNNYEWGPHVPVLTDGEQVALESIFMLVPFVGIVSNTWLAVAQREKAIREVNQSKERIQALFQMLSHDFGSPLSLVTYVAEVGREAGRIDGKNLEMLGRTSGNLVNMLRRFKSLANVYINKDPISLPSNLTSIVDNLRQTLRPMLDAKQILFEFSSDLAAPVVLSGDPVIYEMQILHNLIHNAIKFSDPGTTIRLHITSDRQGFVKLELSDQGTGISPAKLQKIFSWTESTSSQGTHGENGTGFGLPIVKMCVDFCGGTIAVTSRERSQNSSGGTTFQLVLPVYGLTNENHEPLTLAA